MEMGPIGLRFAGMTIGVLVSFASASVPFDAVGLSGLFGPLGIGLAGAPVAAVLGWWLSPHIASSSWRNAIAIGLGAGLLAPPLGLLELLYLAGLSGLAEGPGRGAETIAGLVVIGMFGLGYCWVVLPITLPSGIAAALIVRGLLPRVSWSADPSASIGFRHAVVVLGLIALGAALVPFVQSG
jgi:hypothetical protein